MENGGLVDWRRGLVAWSGGLVNWSGGLVDFDHQSCMSDPYFFIVLKLSRIVIPFSTYCNLYIKIFEQKQQLEILTDY